MYQCRKDKLERTQFQTFMILLLFSFETMKISILLTGIKIDVTVLNFFKILQLKLLYDKVNLKCHSHLGARMTNDGFIWPMEIWQKWKIQSIICQPGPKVWMTFFETPWLHHNMTLLFDGHQMSSQGVSVFFRFILSEWL